MDWFTGKSGILNILGLQVNEESKIVEENQQIECNNAESELTPRELLSQLSSDKTVTEKLNSNFGAKGKMPERKSRIKDQINNLSQKEKWLRKRREEINTWNNEVN